MSFIEVVQNPGFTIMWINGVISKLDVYIFWQIWCLIVVTESIDSSGDHIDSRSHSKETFPVLHKNDISEFLWNSNTTYPCRFLVIILLTAGDIALKLIDNWTIRNNLNQSKKFLP